MNEWIWVSPITFIVGFVVGRVFELVKIKGLKGLKELKNE